MMLNSTSFPAVRIQEDATVYYIPYQYGSLIGPEKQWDEEWVSWRRMKNESLHFFAKRRILHPDSPNQKDSEWTALISGVSLLQGELESFHLDRSSLLVCSTFGRKVSVEGGWKGNKKVNLRKPIYSHIRTKITFQEIKSLIPMKEYGSEDLRLELGDDLNLLIAEQWPIVSPSISNGP